MSQSFLLRGLDWKALLVIGVLVAAAIAVPLSAGSPDSPFYLSTATTILVGKYLCFALLALSVGLVWGYGGILSLGHAAFFALGGYAMGMYLMRQIGTRGVYGHPVLPDFMVFLNWDALPWFWNGFDQFWFAAIMIVLVPGLLAFLFGWFAFRSRVTGVYLSIITQALTFALWQAFLLNEVGFGGNNGFTDFKDILGANIQAPSTRAALFAASAIALAIGYWICRSVTASKYGKVLIAVRDAESRARFLGYRVDRYKLFVFTLSACMAGIAGALYVPQAGIINPGEFAPARSIEAVVWVAVGGRGTLVGPIVGGIFVNWAKSFFTSGPLAEYWLFILGGMFVAVTLFLPKGIVGTVAYGWNALKARRASREAQEGMDTETPDPDPGEPAPLPMTDPPVDVSATRSPPAPDLSRPVGEKT
ncbi:MAG: urea ABC transporter permease subunit UrtC [Bauldia sp.]